MMSTGTRAYEPRKMAHTREVCDQQITKRLRVSDGADGVTVFAMKSGVRSNAILKKRYCQVKAVKRLE